MFPNSTAPVRFNRINITPEIVQPPRHTSGLKPFSDKVYDTHLAITSGNIQPHPVVKR